MWKRRLEECLPFFNYNFFLPKSIRDRKGQTGFLIGTKRIAPWTTGW
jgi:hypothetical protein